MRCLAAETRYCLDAAVGRDAKEKPIKLFRCHGNGHNQASMIGSPKHNHKYFINRGIARQSFLA